MWESPNYRTGSEPDRPESLQQTITIIITAPRYCNTEYWNVFDICRWVVLEQLRSDDQTFMSLRFSVSKSPATSFSKMCKQQLRLHTWEVLRVRRLLILVHDFWLVLAYHSTFSLSLSLSLAWFHSHLTALRSVNPSKMLYPKLCFCCLGCHRGRFSNLYCLSSLPYHWLE